MRKLYLNILRILWIWVVAMATPAFAQDLIQDEDRIDQLKSKMEAYQKKRDGLLEHMVDRHKNFYEGYLSFFNEQKKIRMERSFHSLYRCPRPTERAVHRAASGR